MKQSKGVGCRCLDLPFDRYHKFMLSLARARLIYFEYRAIIRRDFSKRAFGLIMYRKLHF